MFYFGHMNIFKVGEQKEMRTKKKRAMRKHNEMNSDVWPCQPN